MKYKLLIVAFVFLFQTAWCAAAPQEHQCDHCPTIQTPSQCAGCIQRRTITLRDMWDREHPDGTQHGHQAYRSNGGYYYHRPYNAGHYRQHRMRLERSVRPYAPAESTSRFSKGFQYVDAENSHLFRPLVHDTDVEINKSDRLEESRVLEFSDWNRYEAARSAWEKRQALNEKAETAARLSSHAK